MHTSLFVPLPYKELAIPVISNPSHTTSNYTIPAITLKPPIMHDEFRFSGDRIIQKRQTCQATRERRALKIAEMEQQYIDKYGQDALKALKEEIKKAHPTSSAKGLARGSDEHKKVNAKARQESDHRKKVLTDILKSGCRTYKIFKESYEDFENEIIDYDGVVEGIVAN